MDIVFDIETLATSDNSIVLSYAATPLKPTKNFQELVDSSFFVKLRMSEQKELGRSIDRETVKWWSKQSDEAKAASFNINPDTEVDFKHSLHLFNGWLNDLGFTGKHSVWTRGGLDSACIESLCKMAGVEPPFKYWQIRDVRTAIDILMETTDLRGYCKTDPDILQLIIKHHPVYDCAYDAFMLMNGV